jgi:hypothetical protein
VARDPKELSEIDQHMAQLADSLPPFLWRFYKGCLDQGFNEAQAWSLTLTYVANTFNSAKGK